MFVCVKNTLRYIYFQITINHFHNKRVYDCAYVAADDDDDANDDDEDADKTFTQQLVNFPTRDFIIFLVRCILYFIRLLSTKHNEFIYMYIIFARGLRNKKSINFRKKNTHQKCLYI